MLRLISALISELSSHKKKRILRTWETVVASGHDFTNELKTVIALVTLFDVSQLKSVYNLLGLGCKLAEPVNIVPAKGFV